MPEPAYAFGSFVLDMQRRRLLLDDKPVTLPDRHLDVLHVLVARAGEIVRKEELIAAAWKDVAVGDNSLDQAVSSLRRKLGAAPDGEPWFDTLARRGYRFRGPVTTSANRAPDDALESLLHPYRVFVEGRAAIETLERDAVRRAAVAFDEVLRRAPDYAPAHIGIANAAALMFDATRLGGIPDIASLQRAVFHAREACRLDPSSGEAWGTLAFVLSRTPAGVDAVAAGRRATWLEPENWRHHVRLAYAAWGDERLRAAHNALRHLPGFGLAHWLAATVYVARQAFDDAARELVAGAAAQDAQAEGGRFAAVGLHLLLGLVAHAQGDCDAAVREIERELTFESSGHIYSTQVCAAAWCALGAIRLRMNRNDSNVVAAFEQTLERAPAHPMALAAMAELTRGRTRWAFRTRLQQRVLLLEHAGAVVDAAAAMAVSDVLAGRHAAAADRVLSALRGSSDGASGGWGIPVDPLLGVVEHGGEWNAALALLRGRAA